MRKQLIILVLTVVAAISIIVLIVKKQKLTPVEQLNRLTRIPVPKPHQHVSSDGKVVEHTHTYFHSLVQPTQTESQNNTGSNKKDYMKMNRIQRAWAQLNLAEIKDKWQPYTVDEMREKWFYETMVMPTGPNYKELWGAIDKEMPPDQWIQRCLDMGYPFHKHWHYRKALGHRKLFSQLVQETFNESVKNRTRLLAGVGLPPEATWEEFVDTRIKHKVLAELAFDKQHREEPNAEGGVFWVSSGVIPFKSDTVYVHVSDDGPVSHFIGPKLSRKQKDDLTMYGIVPEGMKVVYTDKAGIPLPPDVKPRFYERAMAQLDAAEQRVLKQIADHDELFRQPENETQQETKPIVVDTQHDHPHPHEKVAPTDTAKKSDVQQKIPPQVGKNRQPPLPPEPPSPEQVQKWFEELILLHGGDLPKDLKALQEVIKELEAIRKIGREMAPPRPPERPALPNNTPSEQ